MAVALDAASSVALAGVTSASWSHTASGSDRGGMLGISAGTGGIPTIPTRTWAGVTMTLVPSGTLHDANGQDVWLYQLIAPATGSQTVAFTGSIALYGGAGSVSVTGADQTTMTGTAVTGQVSLNVNGPALVVGSAAGDLVIDIVKQYAGGAGSATPPTVGASQSAQWQAQDGSFFEWGSCSTEPGAASVTMSSSHASSGSIWCAAAVNIIASTAGATAVNVGKSSQMFHPGRGVLNQARFHHRKMSTDIPSGAVSQDCDGTLSATGMLTASAATDKPITATLAGTGTLSSSAASDKPVSGSLAGTGTLSSSASSEKPVTATLAATGTLSATADVVSAALNATGTLTGTGTLTASAVSDKPVSATLAGTGTLTGSAASTKSVIGSLAGTGSLTASAATDKPVTATAAGTGTLSGAASATKPATATLAATGTLSATGSTDKPVQATLAGTGTLSATATVVTAGLDATGALTGTGTLTASATVTKPVTATLAGTGTLSASATVVPLVTHSATASLSGTASATASMTVIKPLTASLVATAAATATAALQLLVQPGEIREVDLGQASIRESALVGASIQEANIGSASIGESTQSGPSIHEVPVSPASIKEVPL